MPNFRYLAFTIHGTPEAGEVNAASSADAIRELTKRGLLVYDTVDAGETARPSASQGSASQRTATWGLRLFDAKVSPRDYAEFARELSVMVRSEVPLDQALRLMTSQTRRRGVQALVTAVHANVIGGQALSLAIEQNAPNVPPVFAALVRAGEVRGNLGEALAELADFLERRVETQAKLQSALTYPVVLAVATVMVAGIIMTFLVPALLPMFEGTGVTPPLVLRLAQVVTSAVTDHALALGAGGIATVLLMTMALRTQTMRDAFDRLALAVPGIGSWMRKTNLAPFSRTLGTLLRNGVALVPALKISSTVVPSRAIARAIMASADDVNEGRKLSASLAQSGYFSEIAMRYVAIGEESSKLDVMLLHLAGKSEKETERQVDTIMTLVGPAMTVTIGSLVGALILSVMQAILSVNELVLR